VPDGEQRIWRNLTRMKLQLVRDRVRLQSQIECLLEEMRIKLSVVVTDLLGLSGLRILHALANGETDAKSLALLGDHRLKCSDEQLIEALTGSSQPMHRQMLALQLERLRLIDEQIATLNSLVAQAMNQHQDTVIRLAEVPGLGIDSAQQIIAEVGVTAGTFPSAAEFTSWVGTCPGKQESAEENSSSRSAKGNKYMRRVLNQAANAAARSKGTHFQAVFRRLLPRLGYQSAVWAIAHRLCRLVWKILHQGISYIEQGIESEPKLLIYRFQRAGNRLQVASRQVQVNGGVSELGMTEKNLDGAQVGAGFQHMSRETMPQAVRRHMLGDACTLGGLAYCLPDDLLCNGNICPPTLHRTGEQIGLGLHPAPILAQSLQKLRGQQHVTIAATLALAHMNDHALAVDVGDLEVAHLGPPQARCIQHHHHGAMHQVAGRIDQTRHLLLVEYGWQSKLTLGKWYVIRKVRPTERLDEKKTQGASSEPNGPR
jgi:transposase